MLDARTYFKVKHVPAVHRRTMRFYKTSVEPPGGPVQRCSQGTVGAPAASKPHSCSPGPRPLQSPAVTPSMGTAHPGGGGARRTNNNNIQHGGRRSDTDRDPHSTRTWTGARTQSLGAAQERRGGGRQRGDRGGGTVGGWISHVSFHFLHHLLVGGGSTEWAVVPKGGTVLGVGADYIWWLVGGTTASREKMTNDGCHT